MEILFGLMVTGLVVVVVWLVYRDWRDMKNHREAMDRFHENRAEAWIRSLPRFDDYTAEAMLREVLRQSWEEKKHDWKKEGF